MIDALLVAVKDTIINAGINFDQATCRIRDDGRPTPRAGNWFVSIHGGTSRATADNQLFELYDFSVTLTKRIVRHSIDNHSPVDERVRDAQGNRYGFNAKIEQLRRILHMNWDMTVLTGKTPNSANDNLIAWGSGTTYGFVEPPRYRGTEIPTLQGGEWFSSNPEAKDVGIKAQMSFADCKRFQPQTAAVGPYL